MPSFCRSVGQVLGPCPNLSHRWSRWCLAMPKINSQKIPCPKLPKEGAKTTIRPRWLIAWFLHFLLACLIDWLTGSLWKYWKCEGECLNTQNKHKKNIWVMYNNFLKKVFSVVPSQFFFVQDERPKPSQQFAMRFGTAMDKMSVSRNSISFSKKTEKDKSYEGLRLPLSPLGTVLWVRISFNRIGIGKRSIRIKSFKGVSRKSVSKKQIWICQCCKDNFKLLLLLTKVFIKV